MPEPTQADIMAALASQAQSSSRRTRPSTVPFDSFDSDDLITPPSDAPAGRSDKEKLQGRNKRKVYCFREGCACLILLPGAGEVIETKVPMLPDDPSSPFPSQSTSTSSPSTASASVSASASKHLYLRVPTAFDFENVGYSRPASGDASTLLPPDAPGLAEAASTASAGGAAAAGVKVKWLICADCDLGPIGWGYEGGKEAYLDMSRCRYAAAQ